MLSNHVVSIINVCDPIGWKQYHAFYQSTLKQGQILSAAAYCIHNEPIDMPYLPVAFMLPLCITLWWPLTSSPVSGRTGCWAQHIWKEQEIFSGNCDFMLADRGPAFQYIPLFWYTTSLRAKSKCCLDFVMKQEFISVLNALSCDNNKFCIIQTCIYRVLSRNTSC